MRKFANIQAVCGLWSNIEYEIWYFWALTLRNYCQLWWERFYNKNVQFKVLPLNTASCKGENWVNKEEKSQYWEQCYEAAFTALSCLLYNLLYWAEKTVFIQSYPTKLWILTQKSFIEQNKMLVLSIHTSHLTLLSAQISDGLGSWSFNLKWKSRDFYLIFIFLLLRDQYQSRVLLCKNCSVPQYQSGVSRTIKIEHGHQGDVPTNNQRVPPLIVTNYIFISSYPAYLHWQLLPFRWQKQSLFWYW